MKKYNTYDAICIKWGYRIIAKDSLMALRPKHIIILTGAGISAESGIATFRASDGLWEHYRIEDVCTPEAFERNPQLVQDFYNARRKNLLEPHVKPNAAHLALAKLQKSYKGKVTLVTQNIDNLHEQAGSRDVIHMHGELLKVRCVKTAQCYEWTEDVTGMSHCCCCQPAQVLRPHIVWFGEIPLHMDEIYRALADADLFVAIGTSGNVYPAAGFVAEASANQADTLEINLEPGKNKTLFNNAKYGLASQQVPLWVDSLLNEESPYEISRCTDTSKSYFCK